MQMKVRQIARLKSPNMTDINLIQPNVITQARYVFSDTEMKVLIYIIKTIQVQMNKNHDFEANKDLFGQYDFKIFFHLSEIDEDETNLKRIKTALRALRHRDFEVDNEKEWFNVGLINYSMYSKEARKWEIQVSHKLMPYMVHLATGYTNYQLETVLKLNTHAQRLYMMFSQYHNTGVFKVDADRLRDMLALNNKYKRYLDFKSRVITDSINQINLLFEQGKSDISIHLKEDKKRRGADDWDRLLDFRIAYTKRIYKQAEQEKEEDLRYVANILRSTFPTDEKYANALLGHLVTSQKLKPFANRLERMEALAEKEGKGYSAYGGLLRSIAQKDYGFKTKI